MVDENDLLVTREEHYGAHRFNEIKANMGAPRDIWSRRLASLAKNGSEVAILEPFPAVRVPCDVGRVALQPALSLLDQWGTKWLRDAPHTDPAIQANTVGSRESD